MTTRNSNIRLCENNLAGESSSLTYSSQLAAYPISNVQTGQRSQVAKFSGHFEIGSTNKYLYINDGSNKTVTLTEDDYDTPDDMATHVQTQMNAVSSNWTVAYSSTTYKFTISNTGSVTLRHTITTNAAWDTLGFTASGDDTGTSFEADEQRNHTDEYIIADLGSANSITFFGAIGLIDENFNISSTATIKIQGNNVSTFTAPPVDVSLTPHDDGIYKFLDDIADTNYRYWKFLIIDRLNADGPSGLKIGNLYIGDYVTFDTNIGSFQIGEVDPSGVVQSINGALYFDLKPKYNVLSGLRIGLVNQSDRAVMKTAFSKLGKTTPFYLSLDPLENISEDLQEHTKFVVFNKEPQFKHVKYDIFSFNFGIRELV